MRLREPHHLHIHEPRVQPAPQHIVLVEVLSPLPKHRPDRPVRLNRPLQFGELLEIFRLVDGDEDHVASFNYVTDHDVAVAVVSRLIVCRAPEQHILDA
jgi:hypothetical protein